MEAALSDTRRAPRRAAAMRPFVASASPAPTPSRPFSGPLAVTPGRRRGTRRGAPASPRIGVLGRGRDRRGVRQRLDACAPLLSSYISRTIQRHPSPRDRYACLGPEKGRQKIHYEEYSPYGSSAYRSSRSGVEVSAKRYRYVGLECDDETGLYSMGARYYAAWLGRWTSADPIGIGADGPGLYNYTRGSPVNLIDPSGTQGTENCDKSADPATCEEAHGTASGHTLEVMGGALRRIGHAVLVVADELTGGGPASYDARVQIYEGQRSIVNSDASTGDKAVDLTNSVNPIYHFLISGIEADSAIERGDYVAAGENSADAGLAVWGGWQLRGLARRPPARLKRSGATDAPDAQVLPSVQEQSPLEIFIGKRPSGTLVEPGPNRLFLNHFTDNKGRGGMMSSRELRASDPETAWSLNREGKYDAGYGDRSETRNVFLTDLSATELEMIDAANPGYVRDVLGIRSTEQVIVLDVAKLREAGIPVYKNPSLPNVYNAIADSIPVSLFENIADTVSPF